MSGTPLPAQGSPIYAPPSQIPVVTTPFLPGYRVTRVIGVTFGLIVRSRGLGRNIVAGFRSLAGGEITEYTQLLEQSRHEAIARLTQHAQSLGANAVLSVGFDTSEMSEIMTEIMAFGTAVVVEPDPSPAQPVSLR
ncbi:MAG: heavy metal-binding domain-containing protein [Thermoplasmata archaeon]